MSLHFFTSGHGLSELFMNIYTHVDSVTSESVKLLGSYENKDLSTFKFNGVGKMIKQIKL